MNRRVVRGWTFSNHAWDAYGRRGFLLADVLAALDHPEVSYSNFDYGPDRYTHQRGKVSVVLNRRTRTVITVLLRSQAQWTDGDARRENDTAA